MRAPCPSRWAGPQPWTPGWEVRPWEPATFKSAQLCPDLRPCRMHQYGPGQVTMNGRSVTGNLILHTYITMRKLRSGPLITYSSPYFPLYLPLGRFSRLNALMIISTCNYLIVYVNINIWIRRKWYYRLLRKGQPSVPQVPRAYFPSVYNKSGVVTEQTTIELYFNVIISFKDCDFMAFYCLINLIIRTKIFLITEKYWRL